MITQLRVALIARINTVTALGSRIYFDEAVDTSLIYCVLHKIAGTTDDDSMNSYWDDTIQIDFHGDDLGALETVVASVFTALHLQQANITMASYNAVICERKRERQTKEGEVYHIINDYHIHTEIK